MSSQRRTQVDISSGDSGIEAAARALEGAWESGAACPPVRDMLPAGDIDAAYAVQNIRTEQLVARGRRIVGRKIGLTSPAVQQQLGIDQPDYGMLFDDMDVPVGETLAWGRVMQPRVEAELAFILGDDLYSDRLVTGDILRAVEYVVPAIEIVGSRIANWSIQVVDTIADNASSGAFVLGHQVRRLSECDLIGAQMTLSRGGEIVARGSGAACLGSPLSALLWLARTMVHRGRPLRKGDIVLSGALGPMVTVMPGNEFEAQIEGFGRVRAVFGTES